MGALGCGGDLHQDLAHWEGLLPEPNLPMGIGRDPSMSRGSRWASGTSRPGTMPRYAPYTAGIGNDIFFLLEKGLEEVIWGSLFQNCPKLEPFSKIVPRMFCI